MTTTLPISKVMMSLADVREKLGLQVSLDQGFFSEWQRELTEFEMHQIDQLQARFAAHRDGLRPTVGHRGTVAAGAVDKLLLLSPLLDLVGFYELEFGIQTEQTVEFAVLKRLKALD
jgi:hypothetical protein